MSTLKTTVEQELEQLLSRRDLAQRWHCCIETVKRRERANLISALRFNARLIRYRLADIREYEQQAAGGAK